MVPVVSELPLVLAGNEKRRRRAAFTPPLAAHAPQLGERQAHALVNDPSLAQLDFANAVRFLGIAAVAHVLDQKGPGARHSKQSLTRPLVRDVRRAHHQRSAGPPLRQHLDSSQRHIGLARSAFGNDPRRLGFAEVLRGAGDGKRLGRQRLAQKRCNARRDWVSRTLKRRVGFENASAQFDRMGTQVIERGFHADTSQGNTMGRTRSILWNGDGM